ncbi:hypothetical protein PAAG_06337 [Paracoccidioides lutzii Pb01]|uniref:Uncharacterized protein n=1 Tax=Paracoccidioides lutzii (strain ATCC MYA-826 / Pb01) TaxID=502779 RepID=C1H6E6_PARBA|nr:hypothetical protein PAAG_06337 [Paracoccidioides lutzii Pb01]EEH35290.2 hypothetical protein PAAG_06337 [Paracoccidioides lutzii Pb01]
MPGRASYPCAAGSDTSSKKIDRSRSGVTCVTRPWRLLREMNDSTNSKGNNPKPQPQLGVTGVSEQVRRTSVSNIGADCIRRALSGKYRRKHGTNSTTPKRDLRFDRALSEVTVGTENKQPGSGSNEEKRAAGIP